VIGDEPAQRFRPSNREADPRPRTARAPDIDGFAPGSRRRMVNGLMTDWHHNNRRKGHPARSHRLALSSTASSDAPADRTQRKRRTNAPTQPPAPPPLRKSRRWKALLASAPAGQQQQPHYALGQSQQRPLALTPSPRIPIDQHGSGITFGFS